VEEKYVQLLEQYLNDMRQVARREMLKVDIMMQKELLLMQTQKEMPDGSR